jgi:hypothetical protein
MHQTNNPPRWPFYLLWILAPLLGMPLAFVLDLALIHLITRVAGNYVTVNGVRHLTEDYVGASLFLPLAGLVTGLLQAALLRRALPQVRWWLTATLGGWLLGAFLTQIPGWLHWTHALLTADVALLVMGGSIGVSQWLVLRRRAPHAGWWIGATTVGWALVALVTDLPAFGPFDLVILGVLPAAVTALLIAYGMRLGHGATRDGVTAG